jgi:hypothetical protein
METKGCGVLDTPLEPVIGLAEGETRWRSMTVFVGAEVAPNGRRSPGRQECNRSILPDRYRNPSYTISPRASASFLRARGTKRCGGWAR